VNYARALTVNEGAVLTLNQNGSNTGVLSGNGTITVSGAVGPVLSNSGSTFTGTVNPGYGLSIANLGDSSNPIVLGNFTWTGGAKTFALRPVISSTASGYGYTINNSGTGALTIQQNLTFAGAGSRTLTLGGSYGTTANQFAGNIGDNGASAVSITKSGDNSIWVLSGNNTYSGATALNVGGGGTSGLIFQGMQALPTGASLNQTAAASTGQNGYLIKILDDSAAPDSRSAVNLNLTTSEGQAVTDNRGALKVFVGNNSVANGGTSSSTQTGSTIQLGDLSIAQTSQTPGSNVGGLALSGANGYKLQIGAVKITPYSTVSGSTSATLYPTTAALIVTGTVQQQAGATSANVNLKLDGTAAGNLISGNILNSADGTPRALSVSKTGTGDWTLSGSNSYTGGTTITTGKLQFNGADSLPTSGTVAVGASGHLSLADGTARSQTVSALTLTSLGSLTFDWTGDSIGDQLTSTADITPTAGSVFYVNLNLSGTPGGSVTLLTGGAGSTLSSSSFYLANATNYTATLTTPAVNTLVLSGHTPQTPATTLYWVGDKLSATIAGVRNAWALSDGTKGNWSTTTTAYTATPLTPRATTDAIFANSQVGKTQQSTVLGADVTAKSVTIDDSVAVTIAGANGATLTLVGTSGTAGTVASPGSAISVTANANATSTISSRVNLGANQTWNVASGKTLTVSGEVTGSFSLTKADAGTVILSGANTYSGNTTISAGTLRIGHNTAGTLGAGNYPGNIVNNGTLQIWSTANQTLSGVISGSGNLQKAYGGTLTLAGNNTYTGQTLLQPQTTTGFTIIVSSFNSVNGGTPLMASSSLGAPTTVGNGTIELGGGAQAGVTITYMGTGETTDRVINFAMNGTGATKTLNASGSGLLKFTSTFTKTGSDNNDITLQGTGNGEIVGGLNFVFRNFTKTGNGTWTLGGNLGHTGTTTISGGTLQLGNSGAAGSINTASAISVASGAIFTVNQSDTVTQGTDFSAAAITGAGGFTQAGSGTNILTAVNTYSGPTTVSAGTLRVDGSLASVVTVNSGGTLGGSGTIAGASASLIKNGAALAPGSTLGTLTFSNGLTLEAGATVALELGASSDSVRVSGGTFTSPASGTVTVNIAAPLGSIPAGEYTLMDWTGSSAVSVDLTDFTVNLPEGANGAVTMSGTKLLLTVSSSGTVFRFR